ncbi:MAG TPA: hypothetical protein VKY44_09460 [Flavobacterium sp.]|nr:hypothetical protein [Flavobacterium sp.]
MTEEEKNKIEEFMLSKLNNYKCPVCNGSSFESSDRFTIDLVHGTLNKILTEQTYQFSKKFYITCQSCGHMTYFNADILEK